MLDWLFEIAQTSPLAHALGLVSLVCAAGMAVGSIKIRQIGLGGAGVLLMGILTALISEPVDAKILSFIKEFGLVLFVFTIGLQLGPGFFASLRSDGLRLNLLTACLIVLAGLLAPLLGWLAGLDPISVPGLFAGASTNVPALGAAQQSLAALPGLTSERLALPALACAVSYPAAIVGVLGALLVLKIVFRIDPAQEAQTYADQRRQAVEPLPREAVIGENPEPPGIPRTIAVTNKKVLGKTPAELGLAAAMGVTVARITRGDSEMTAVPGLRLHFGDILQVVGPESQLDRVADLLGNSLQKLNETQFIPLFAGIFLGILAGSLPLAIPGLSQPLRMGLAGGTLIVALILGRLGHIGPLVWHMPLSANHAFREFGIALFFAALGLAAGDHFFSTVLSPRGLVWLATGLAITVAPLLAIGIWARVVAKMDFVTLGGLLAGGMTNPPALSFVNNLCRSEAPTLAYATVYPLSTVLRILVAQVLAVMLGG